MSEQNPRYLNQSEAMEVNQYADEYVSDPPAWHDPILDPIDQGLLRDEPIPTLEQATALARIRRAEAEQRMKEIERGPVSTRVLQSIAADDAMADLDDCLWANVRDQAGVAEDGGQAFADATYEEITAAQKQVKGQRERAAAANRETARRFAGFGYKSVSAAQFERGKR